MRQDNYDRRPQSSGNQPSMPNLTDIKADTFSSLAEDWAKYVSESKAKSTQIRRFYDEVVKWHSATRGLNEEDFNKKLPFIRMLSAMVAYSKGRKHVSESFTKMIDESVRQVSNYETLNNFKHFFEAFVGYYKVYGPKS